MDAYVKPGDVHAPKRRWQLLHVLFDGGEDQPGKPGLNSSLALGRWDNRPVLAMRWNGGKDNPIGNPQSRGLATWFIVPGLHVRQLLETGQNGFSDDKIRFAMDFLDMKRVYFLTHCPNPACREYGAIVLTSYRPEELQERIEELERDELGLYHIICDHHWPPSPEDKKRLLADLKMGLEQRKFAAGSDTGLIRYAHAKLADGIGKLATHPGGVRDRLFAAFSHSLVQVPQNGLPDEAKTIWEEQIWRHVQNGEPGSMLPTIEALDEGDAVKIAQAIVTVDALVESALSDF